MLATSWRSLISRICGLVLTRLMSAKLGLTDTTCRPSPASVRLSSSRSYGPNAGQNRCGGAVVSSSDRNPCPASARNASVSGARCSQPKLHPDSGRAGRPGAGCVIRPPAGSAR
jgi:hypothetical protein